MPLYIIEERKHVIDDDNTHIMLRPVSYSLTSTLLHAYVRDIRHKIRQFRPTYFLKNPVFISSFYKLVYKKKLVYDV